MLRFAPNPSAPRASAAIRRGSQAGSLWHRAGFHTSIRIERRDRNRPRNAQGFERKPDRSLPHRWRGSARSVLAVRLHRQREQPEARGRREKRLCGPDIPRPPHGSSVMPQCGDREIERRRPRAVRLRVPAAGRAPWDRLRSPRPAQDRHRAGCGPTPQDRHARQRRPARGPWRQESPDQAEKIGDVDRKSGGRGGKDGGDKFRLPGAGPGPGAERGKGSIIDIDDNNARINRRRRHPDEPIKPRFPQPGAKPQRIGEEPNSARTRWSNPARQAADRRGWLTPPPSLRSRKVGSCGTSSRSTARPIAPASSSEASAPFTFGPAGTNKQRKLALGSCAVSGSRPPAASLGFHGADQREDKACQPHIDGKSAIFSRCCDVSRNRRHRKARHFAASAASPAMISRNSARSRAVHHERGQRRRIRAPRSAIELRHLSDDLARPRLTEGEFAVHPPSQPTAGRALLDEIKPVSRLPPRVNSTCWNHNAARVAARRFAQASPRWLPQKVQSRAGAPQEAVWTCRNTMGRLVCCQARRGRSKPAHVAFCSADPLRLAYAGVSVLIAGNHVS